MNPDSTTSSHDDLLVVLDVGDVLVRTAPGAHYHALAHLLGVSPSRVAAAADPTGLIDALERSRVTFTDFAGQLRHLTGSRANVTTEAMQSAFCDVLASVNRAMLAAAAPFAATGRLILASNTSQPHWQHIRNLLAGTALAEVPTCLSFRIGHRKPEPEFFHALAGLCGQHRSQAVFLDDRAENAAAATHHGFAGYQHTATAASVAWLTSLT